MIYLLMFGITALLGWLIQKPFCESNKPARVVLSILIVLIPSVLGGIRSRYLGTDNIVYARQFEAAVTTSAQKILFSGTTEIMSRVLRLIISRLTSDYHWFFFAVELITMSFAYAGLYYFRDRVRLWLSLLVYMFCFYCMRIHLIWQGAALAVVFFAFRYVLERKPLKYFLFLALAILFHTSAVIGLTIYLFYQLLSMPENRKHPISLYPGVLIAAILVLIILLPAAGSLLIRLNILPKSYGTYLRGMVRPDPEETITRLPLLLISTLLYRDVKQRDPLYKFLFVMLWAEFLIAQYGSVYSHSWRISLYYGYFNMLSIPYLLKVIRKEQPDGTVAVMLVLAYLIVFWVYWFVLNNRGFSYPVYPFITDLL